MSVYNCMSVQKFGVNVVKSNMTGKMNEWCLNKSATGINIS